MGNRAGNLDFEDLLKVEHKGEIVCACGKSKTGWMPELLPDGRVVLCCNDYGMQHVLGNLFTESWSEIVNGDEYRSIEAGMKDDTIPILCRTCGAAIPKNKIPPAWENNDIYYSYIIKVNRLFKDARKEKEINNDFCLKNKIQLNKKTFLNKVIKAKNICIFGLGDYFEHSYFQNNWQDIIKATIFSDNNSDKWEKEYGEIACIPPNKLKEYEDLLVITYVKNDDLIVNQLRDNLDIYNVINIDEFYHIFD